MIISSAYILAAGKSKRIVPPIDVGGVYMRYAYAGFSNYWQYPWAGGWGAATPSACRLNDYFTDEYYGAISGETVLNPGAPIFGKTPQGASCTPNKDSITSYATTSPWPDNSLLQTVSAGGNITTFTTKMNVDPTNEDLISGAPIGYKAVLSLGLPNGKSGRFKVRRMIEVTIPANIWTDGYNWWSGLNVPIIQMYGTPASAANTAFYGGFGTYGPANLTYAASWSGDDMDGNHRDIIQNGDSNWQDLTGNHTSIQTYDSSDMLYNLGARSSGGDKITYFFDESIEHEWWVSPNFVAGSLYNSSQRRNLAYKDGVLNIVTGLSPLYFGGIGSRAITGRLYDLAKDDVFVKVTITLTPVS